MSSFTAREKRLGLRNKKSQQNICFTWEWRPLNARQFNNEELDKSLNLPVVQVFLYEAKNVYDDRFDMHPSTTRKASRQTRKPDEIKTVNLTLAQTWSYLCDENGRTTFGHCIKSAFVGRTLLSEGTYVYLYSVDGKLQLGQEDEKTCLGSKREVHYIDVREQRREDTFDQGKRTETYFSQSLLRSCNRDITLDQRF